MFQRPQVLILILFVACASGFYFFNKNSTQKTAETSLIVSEPLEAELEISKAQEEQAEEKPLKASIPKTKKPKNSKGEPQEKKPDLEWDESVKPESKASKETFENDPTKIRFEIHDEYVIAGDDILLGRLSPENLKKWKAAAGKMGRMSWHNQRVEIWPGGVLPYAISPDLSAEQADMIQEAIGEFHSKTNLRFVEYSGQEADALHFISDPERCASYVGRVGGHQPILVGPGCGKKEMVHELMHALGFIHEHQRSNRDQYLNIHAANILPDKLINFDILPQDHQEIYRRLSQAFDWKSVTFYPPEAFAKSEGLHTMSSKDPQYTPAPSLGLSPGDVLKIQEVYERGFY